MFIDRFRKLNEVYLAIILIILVVGLLFVLKAQEDKLLQVQQNEEVHQQKFITIVSK